MQFIHKTIKLNINLILLVISIIITITITSQWINILWKLIQKNIQLKKNYTNLFKIKLNVINSQNRF